VSELWFRLPDFLGEHFRSDAEAEEFRSHETFLDLPKAVTLAVASHRIPTVGPAPREERP
jgi:hypothetical protein